jgi:hypothetical protein
MYRTLFLRHAISTSFLSRSNRSTIVKRSSNSLILGVLLLEDDLRPTIRERLLKAFLDLAVLCVLMNRPTTCYEINKFFIKEYSIMQAPSTIYSTLNSMEKKGWVKCVQSKHGRIYSLTEQGRKIIKDMPNKVTEINKFVPILLG